MIYQLPTESHHGQQNQCIRLCSQLSQYFKCANVRWGGERLTVVYCGSETSASRSRSEERSILILNPSDITDSGSRAVISSFSEAG